MTHDFFGLDVGLGLFYCVAVLLFFYAAAWVVSRNKTANEWAQKDRDIHSMIYPTPDAYLAERRNDKKT